MPLKIAWFHFILIISFLHSSRAGWIEFATFKMERVHLQGNMSSLYIKCLFKTVSCQELKDHLSRKGCLLESDTFYTMTLKLRLRLLEEANCNEEIQDQLRAEIAFIRNKTGRARGYTCSFSGCDFTTRTYKFLVHHLKTLHMNSSVPIVCQLKGCERVLSSVKMLCFHFKASHQKSRFSTVALRQSQLVEQVSLLKCSSPSCGHQKLNTLKDLKAHLSGFHFKNLEEVTCIFDKCDFKTNLHGTLRSHFSRKHPLQQVCDLKKENLVLDDSSEDINNDVDNEDNFDTVGSLDTEPEDLGFEATVESDDALEDVTNDLNDEDHEVLFTKALAMQFNRWANIKNVPYSTVSEIVTEVFDSYKQGAEVTKKKIISIFRKDGLALDPLLKVLGEVDDLDPFKAARKLLEKDRDRQNFILKEFPNVQPLDIRLNTEDMREKALTLQYVPIKESLKNLLEDETYLAQKIADPYYHEENVIKDCKDGTYFKQNQFFVNNPGAVPIVLFQDELEVANPLGAGKTKHKIQCTYFTTLDVIPAFRTKVRSVQLVSLVLSRHWKKFGNLACNRNFIEDMKHLETEGIAIEKPLKQVVKAGLALIVGDNLGQHMLSEMSSSFSSGNICRVCNATYDDVCKKNLLYSGIDGDYSTEILTKERYDTFADLAVENGVQSRETHGIKGHCVFNELGSFHCVEQCAPCLGHDYFEGCYAYDVQFYLNFLVHKEKLLSLNDLNLLIKNAKLSSRDAKNRPKPFKKGADKYEGNAGSLRVLSRILTTILSSVLEDSCTEEYLIKLHELGEIITAPSLTITEIEVTMTQIITEYLDLRAGAVEALGMPNARPKHHFLYHYPRAYRNLGPLIYVWAMRLESKHTFFKGVVRAAKNFKNVPLTCALRHQRAQITYRYQGLFPTHRLEIPDAAPRVTDAKKMFEDPLLKQYLSSLNHDTLIPKFIKIFGTRYEAGQVLIVKKLDFGLLKVGLIRCITCTGTDVNFLVSSFEASQSKFGYYVTTKVLAPSEIVSYATIHDYYPLEMRGTIEAFSFCLHHFITG